MSLCTDSVSGSWLFDYENWDEINGEVEQKIYCYAYKNGDLGLQPEIIEMNYDSNNEFLVCNLPENLKDSNYIQLYFVNSKGEAIKSGDNSSFKMKYTDFGMYRMHVWAAIDMHEHEYGDDFKSDSENHWHECRVCSEKTDEEKHIPSEWIIDRQATQGSDGSAHRECTVCKHVLETKIIEKLSQKEVLNKQAASVSHDALSATGSTKSALNSTKNGNSISSNKKSIQTGGGSFATLITTAMILGTLMICILRVKKSGK